MKNHQLPLLLLSLWLCLGSIAFAQPLTQTVRGQLTDAASKVPVTGASVVVLGSNPVVGSTTDIDGYFRLENIPIGRITLKITFVGYEEMTIRDIVVTSGKEVVLDLQMTEQVGQLDEVSVVYQRTEDAREPNNEMAAVSARPFNPSETLKFAGSLGDPSRMAANFAGVSGANDARNDIVVRGNSPSTLLWRIDGVNIPNPNHFSSLGTTGGPVSMINANLLAKSDFLTGAFPSEYANALGSVFDLKLRKGNNEKREYLGQMAFNGIELGAEGPYSRKSKASYLLNYRYSLFGLMSNLGFQIAGTPYYQDMTFKTDVPVGKKGQLSAWVIGGASNITFLGKDVNSEGDSYGDENTNTRVSYRTGMAAVKYEHRFTERTTGHVTFSASQSWQKFEGDTVIYRASDSKDILSELRDEDALFVNSKASVNLGLNHKFNARHRLSGGVITDLNRFELTNNGYQPQARTLRNTTGETMLNQAYIQWKYRISQRLTLNSGLSFLHYELNSSSAFEPRAGLVYGLKDGSTLNFGYGLHSNLQPILTYFYQSRQPDGSYRLTNRDLGFTRSHHFVLGHERYLTDNLRLKVEAYYQSLFDVPVERTPSYYSILTEGASFAPIDVGNLVNSGTGTNYGIEMTLEKNFSQGYFFLLTTSLFDSKYKGSDGIERNTPFNSRYVVNVLAGKEFAIGSRGNILTVSWKLTTAGGRFIRMVDLERSTQANTTIYDDSRAFNQQQADYFRTDLKIGYKINKNRLTHEIAIDLQNLTNHQNVFMQAYNPRSGRIGTAYQQSFLPIPFYRLTF